MSIGLGGAYIGACSTYSAHLSRLARHWNLCLSVVVVVAAAAAVAAAADATKAEHPASYDPRSLSY